MPRGELSKEIRLQIQVAKLTKSLAKARTLVKNLQATLKERSCTSTVRVKNRDFSKSV
jgi:hypothetical protein